METASTGELAEALGAPAADAKAKACGAAAGAAPEAAARAGSDLLPDNNAYTFGQPYNGFLVCA